MSAKIAKLKAEKKKVVTSKQQITTENTKFVAQDKSAKSQAGISPRTKLPESHPESQAVEREHYLRQTSLASRSTKKEVEDALETD
jgi:hypothetical protein